MAPRKRATAITNALAVATGDTHTSDILDALDKEINSLKKVTETQYKTTGQIGEGFGCIKEEMLLDNLYHEATMLLAKKTAYEAGMAWLDITTYPPFKWAGFNIEEWREDILLRRAVLEQADRLTKLAGYKDKLSKFLSEKEQKELVIRDLRKELNLSPTDLPEGIAS